MNPTEQEKQIAREAAATAAKRVEIPADGLPEHYYAKGYLAAITAAKQQPNEDTTRLDWLEGRLTNWRNIFGSLDPNTGRHFQIDKPTPESTFRAAIDAARGVQPVAKEDTCGRCGVTIENADEIRSSPEKSWECLACNEPLYLAAKHPSTPTPEQQTETGGKWSRYGSAVVDAAKAWEFGKDTLFVCASADDAKKAIALHAAALDAKAERLRVMRVERDNESKWAHTYLRQNETMREALTRLLLSRGCWNNGEPEIAEEISAQFDVTIDLANLIRSALASAPAARKQDSAPAAEQDLILRLDEILLHAESAITCDLPATESMDIEGAFEQIRDIADRSKPLNTLLNPAAPSPAQEKPIAANAELARYHPAPWKFVEENEATGAGPKVVDANGNIVAGLFWPAHPPEETDEAVQVTYDIGRAIAALASASSPSATTR